MSVDIASLRPVVFPQKFMENSDTRVLAIRLHQRSSQMEEQDQICCNV